MAIRKYVMIATICSCSSAILGGITFRGTSSYIRVASGSTFYLNKPLVVNNGSIIKDSGGTITGATLSFVEGVYTDVNGSISLNGTLDPVGTVTLNNQSMYIEQGVQTIYVQGTNNLLAGSPQFSSDVTLKDASTTLTIALNAAANKNFVLNGGSVTLGNNLSFADNYKIVGPGTVTSNGYSVFLGAGNLVCDTVLTWSNASSVSMTGNVTLTNQWTFYGTNNKITGNGNILTLQGSGAIILAAGAQLTIKDMWLTGVSGNNVRCSDSTGTIILDGVNWVQTGDYTCATGAFNFKNNVFFTGDGTKYIYQSGQASQILSQATLALDANFTYSYDPKVVASKNLLSFADSSATLVLNGGTFHTTGTGTNFTKGTIVLSDNSIMESEAVSLDRGITLGDGISSSNDCFLRIPSKILTIATGALCYKNISPISTIADAYTMIHMAPNTMLALYTSLYLDTGMVCFYGNNTLATADESDIYGSICAFGELTKITI